MVGDFMGVPNPLNAAPLEILAMTAPHFLKGGYGELSLNV